MAKRLTLQQLGHALANAVRSKGKNHTAAWAGWVSPIGFLLTSQGEVAHCIVGEAATFLGYSHANVRQILKCKMTERTKSMVTVAITNNDRGWTWGTILRELKQKYPKAFQPRLTKQIVDQVLGEAQAKGDKAAVAIAPRPKALVKK